MYQRPRCGLGAARSFDDASIEPDRPVPAIARTHPGLHDGDLTLTARVDLAELPTARVGEIMDVLATRADRSEVIAVTYADTADNAAGSTVGVPTPWLEATIRAQAAAAELRLMDHLLFGTAASDPFYAPTPHCWPPDSRPVTNDSGVAAEFVGLGAIALPWRDELANILEPVATSSGSRRCSPRPHAAAPEASQVLQPRAGSLLRSWRSGPSPPPVEGSRPSDAPLPSTTSACGTRCGPPSRSSASTGETCSCTWRGRCRDPPRAGTSQTEPDPTITVYKHPQQLPS